MKNLTPVSVDTISFCDQLIVLESDQARIEIHLRDPELFTSLEELKEEGLEGEVLKLHLSDSSQEQIGLLTSDLAQAHDILDKSNLKIDDLTIQLTKSQNDFQSQSTLLAKTQDDLVTANTKIVELEKAKEVKQSESVQ